MVFDKEKTKEKVVKKTEKKNSAAKPVTNPVDIIAQINAISPKMTANKLYGGYNNTLHNGKKKFNVDYVDFLKKVCTIIKKTSTFQDFYNEIHELLTGMLNASYTGIGLYNDKLNSIHLKVLSKSGATYTSRIFKNDTDSEIIKTFEEDETKISLSSDFLNNPYINNSRVGIFPLSHNGEKCGVFIAGDENINLHIDIYEVVNKLLSLYAINEKLIDMKNISSDVDALTGLSSHRAFQEKLADEIKKAATMKNELSVVIFDVNSISKINRELGHAKGDEIIRTVADKIVQSSSDKSLIGRYGGDEIAVIMPNTKNEEAKYFAEYVAYSLSCCLIDNVGPIRVSIGISSYPENTQDQEKLLIMAEQAMYISQSKGYQHGMATIVSSQDFDFWDDMALSSFASVLTKRHAQVGISFEEESGSDIGKSSQHTS